MRIGDRIERLLHRRAPTESAEERAARAQVEERAGRARTERDLEREDVGIRSRRY
jgi:hypothetical protein